MKKLICAVMVVITMATMVMGASASAMDPMDEINRQDMINFYMEEIRDTLRQDVILLEEDVYEDVYVVYYGNDYFRLHTALRTKTGFVYIDDVVMEINWDRIIEAKTIHIDDWCDVVSSTETECQAWYYDMYY